MLHTLHLSSKQRRIVSAKIIQIPVLPECAATLATLCSEPWQRSGQTAVVLQLGSFYLSNQVLQEPTKTYKKSWMNLQEFMLSPSRKEQKSRTRRCYLRLFATFQHKFRKSLAPRCLYINNKSVGILVCIQLTNFSQHQCLPLLVQYAETAYAKTPPACGKCSRLATGPVTSLSHGSQVAFPGGTRGGLSRLRQLKWKVRKRAFGIPTSNNQFIVSL